MDAKNYLKPDFSSLVVSIASAALLKMREGAQKTDLLPARYNIDLLSLLQEKTQGHLTAEEEKLLKRSISDLQLEFIRKSGASSNENANDKSSNSKGRQPPLSKTEAADRKPADRKPADCVPPDHVPPDRKPADRVSPERSAGAAKNGENSCKGRENPSGGGRQ